MESRDDIIALWCKTFGEPPSVKADFDTLSRILIQHMQGAPPYRPRPFRPGRPNPATRNP